MAVVYVSGGRPKHSKIDVDLLHALKLLDNRFHVFLEFEVPSRQRDMRVQVDALVIRSGLRGHFRVLELKNIAGAVEGGPAGPWRWKSGHHARLDASRSENPFEQIGRISDGLYYYLSREWRGADCRGVYRTLVMPRVDIATSRFMPPRFLRYCLGYGSLVDELATFRPTDYLSHVGDSHIQDLARHLGVSETSIVNGVRMNGDHDPSAAARRVRRRIEEIQVHLDGLKRDLDIIEDAPGQRPSTRTSPTRTLSSSQNQPLEPTTSAPKERVGIDVDSAVAALATAVREMRQQGKPCTAAAVLQRAQRTTQIDPKSLGFKRLTDLLLEGQRRGTLSTWVDEGSGQRLVGVVEP